MNQLFSYYLREEWWRLCVCAQLDNERGIRRYAWTNDLTHSSFYFMCCDRTNEICINSIGDGLCCICNSFVNPHTLVHTCDECNYGSLEGRCTICGNQGVTDAYYCRECVQQGKDRDGCPKIVNLGSTKTDLFYERKKYGFKKRWRIQY